MIAWRIEINGKPRFGWALTMEQAEADIAWLRAEFEKLKLK